MVFNTNWKAATYAYTGSVRIEYEPLPPTDQTAGFSGDFDILPDDYVPWGDTFTLHPKDITTIASCTFQSVKFRIERDGQVFTGNPITSKTTDDIYPLVKYPYVMKVSETHMVYMQINTSCGNTWVGPKELYLSDFGPGPNPGGPNPTPTPEPDNHPPFAKITWTKPGSNEPIQLVAQYNTVDLKALEISDPDYPDDWVDLVGWDFDDTEWLKTVPGQFGDNKQLGAYPSIKADVIGNHHVSLTVKDRKGLTYTAHTQLAVVDAKPVAVIRAPLVVKEGRPMPSPIDGTLSYSPMGLKLTDYVWTNKEERYYVPGQETVTLKVKDEEGRWSDLASKTITVNPDLPPIGILAVPEEATRLGQVIIQSGSYSPDYDEIVKHKMQMKYDAANDGFANDSWQTVVDGDGNADSFTFTPTRVGKYLFQETICEDYGKCGNTDAQPEAKRTLNVKNIAPTADVSTESDVSEAPASTPILMSNLFDTGRFVALQNGTVGDKSNWKVENGVLKTKVKQKIANTSSGVPPIPSIYNAKNGGYNSYFNSSFIGYSGTFGLDNPITFPFASIQSNPAWTEISFPGSAGQQIFGYVDDDKYTYIIAGVVGNMTVYAYDKSRNLKWTTPIDNGLSSTYDNNTETNDQSGNNMSFISHNGSLYLNRTTGQGDYSIYTYRLDRLDRETGRIINEIQYDWTRFWATLDPIGIPGGILARNKKYTYDLQEVATMPTIGNGSAVGDAPLFRHISQKTGMGFTDEEVSNGAGNGWGRYNNIRRLSDFGVVATPYYHPYNGKAYTLGFDTAGNSIALATSVSDNRVFQILITSPSGAVTTKELALPEGYSPGAFVPIGIDNSNQLWMINNDFGYYGTGNCTVYVWNYLTGQLVKSFVPFGVSKSAGFMFVGTDGLVTLLGAYKYGANDYRINYAVIDPSNGYQVMTQGETPGLPYLPSFIHPHDDQSFIIELRNAYQNRFFELKTTAPLKKPKLLDIGESTPDLVAGPNVAADQIVKASFSSDKPDTTATGYAYRIQDDRNYYSVEWEANELRVKKTVNGTATIVFSKAFPLVAKQIYDVKLVPGAGNFALYVNRIAQATISESAWKAGKFGLLNRGQQGVSYLSASIDAGDAPYGTIKGIALVGQQVNYLMSYDDEEKDPQLHAGDAWTYTHNPNVFLQPSAMASFSGQTRNTAVNVFDLPGDYTFTYKTKDDPQPEHRYPDASFDGYRQATNEVLGKIRIHRRPIADFTVTLNADHTLSYMDASYDPDRYDRATGAYSLEDTGINYQNTHGVLEWRYRYRMSGSATYIYSMPTRLYGGTYIIELAVKDEYNAWSDWAVQTIVADGSTPLPPNPGFTVAPNPSFRFSPVTFTSTASDPHDGGPVNLEHAYYMKNKTTGSAETLQSSERQIWQKIFSTLGVFQVRQVVINSYGLYAETSQDVSIVNRKPTGEVTVPSSADINNPTLFTTLRPTFEWVYRDDDDDVQQQYQLRIYRYGDALQYDSGTKYGSALTWTPGADLPDNTKYYVQVRVFDGYDWSGWSAVKYFMIQTNKPPVGDFEWTPVPVWEGDTVKLLPTVDDPDRDSLDLSFEWVSPTGARNSSSQRLTYPYSPSGPTFLAQNPGDWIVTMTVSDGKAPPVTVRKKISVAPLTIAGRVLHTEAWERNRVNYNAKHKDAQRPVDWFWAGEAFVLEASVTDTGSSPTHAVKVTAQATSSLQAGLQAASLPSYVIWKGILTSREYGRPLNELPEGPYTFLFTVTYSNGVQKTALVPIQVVDTVDNYVQVHRVQ